MEQISFQQAVWKLALQFNLITVQQMEDYLNGNLMNAEVKKPPRVYDGIFEDKDDHPIANPDVLDRVFTVFSEGEGLIRKNRRLSTKHLEHLRNERKLTDEEIKEGGYFTIPNRSNLFMRIFLKTLKERYGYEEDILKGIPGFYHLNQLNGMTFVSHKGIGIPVKNEKGQIIGIQIRRDEANVGEKRYVWFSSSFANQKDGMSDGTGSGSPIHVSYPKINRRPSDLYITEGVFKAQQLSKYYQATSVSVQGVQNWKGKINPFIQFLEEEKGQSLSCVHIYFDSDMSKNVHVYNAFRNMYDSLKEDFPNLEFYYYWWDPRLGKGVDDLLLNRLGGEIQRIDCKTYVKAYDKMIEFLVKAYGVPIQKLDKELIEMEFEATIAPLLSPIHERR